MRDVFKEYRQGLLSWDEAFCIANNLAATACTEAVNDEIETEFYTKQMESLGVDAAEQIMKLLGHKEDDSGIYYKPDAGDGLDITDK